MRRVNYGDMLTTEEVIQEIEKAVRKNKPFSLVRVGDGENIVLAQRYVWSLSKVLKTRWARRSRESNVKGIRLPNERARDRLIKAIKGANVVGIPYYNDQKLPTRQKYLRSLTDKCFQKYGIQPKRVCHTLVNRHLVEHESFWKMLEGRKVVVISKWASKFAKLVEREYGDLNIKIVKTLSFHNYSDLAETLKKMQSVKCDIVLISAGVNAVILAQKLAKEQGRVAIDFGKSPMFMIAQNHMKVRPWRGDDHL